MCGRGLGRSLDDNVVNQKLNVSLNKMACVCLCVCVCVCENVICCDTLMAALFPCRST